MIWYNKHDKEDAVDDIHCLAMFRLIAGDNPSGTCVDLKSRGRKAM